MRANFFAEGRSPFSVAVAVTPMPMIFIDAGSAQNEIVYANARFLELMGYERSQILGKSFRSTLAAKQKHSRLILTEFTEESSRKIIKIRCLRHNGEEFDATLLIIPYYGDSGQIEQYFVSYIDAAKRSPQQTVYESRINKLYKHAPGFVAITHGKTHVFSYANDAYKTLVGKRDLEGRTVSAALPEIADQGFLPLLDDVYTSGRHVARSRMPIMLNRGTPAAPQLRYVDFVYAPVLNADEQVIGIFCEGSDVTASEQTEQELRLLQSQLIQLSRLNAMGTMAATLAHELNQPLAAISNFATGCLNLLESSDPPTSTVQEGLIAISAASNRAGGIIRRLRDMTRRTPPESEVFDLSQALVDSIQLVKAGAFENVRVDIHRAGTGVVRADRVQIQQVIINLLKNACEAAQASDDAIVTAEISRADGIVQLQISDNGPGVSPGILKSLFEWVDSTKPLGMGIGLSISRTIIESQGGTIRLERTSASGTCFSISLPECRG